MFSTRNLLEDALLMSRLRKRPRRDQSQKSAKSKEYSSKTYTNFIRENANYAQPLVDKPKSSSQSLSKQTMQLPLPYRKMPTKQKLSKMWNGNLISECVLPNAEAFVEYIGSECPVSRPALQNLRRCGEDCGLAANGSSVPHEIMACPAILFRPVAKPNETCMRKEGRTQVSVHLGDIAICQGLVKSCDREIYDDAVEIVLISNL